MENLKSANLTYTYSLMKNEDCGFFRLEEEVRRINISWEEL